MNIGITNKLNIDNIDEIIKTYKDSLDEMDVNISSSNAIDLFKKLKRTKINKGPYIGISLFESANRIMTDLVILYGIKDLLIGKYKHINFPEYLVEYGNENKNNYDIVANFNGKKLVGEAFNVSPSFFQSKKYISLKKLRKNKESNIILLMYNKDAVDENYVPKLKSNEYHVKVEI